MISMANMDTFCIGLDEFDANLRKFWKDLQKEKDFCDMTLACDGKIIKTHKVIISSISPVLRNCLKQMRNINPCIYLRGVKIKELENLLNFIYQGEVYIYEEDVKSFLEVGKDLQIKGMCEMEMSEMTNSKSDSSPLDPTENRENIETVKLVFSDDPLDPTENIKIETEDTIMEEENENRERSSTKIGPYGPYRPIRPALESRAFSCAVKKVKYESFESNGKSAETEFRCEICSKVFARIGSLNAHKATIHEGVNYPCERCGKTFTQFANLKRHITYVHEGVRSQCALCKKYFGDKSALANHIKTFHEGVRYQCEKCGKNFRQKSLLQKHRESVHNEEISQ